MDDEVRSVRRALRRWSDPVVLGASVPTHGPGSRVWEAMSGSRPIVVKLVRDDPAFVLPGLAVAAHLAARGLRTGPPLPTAEGRLAVPTDRGATLAVLRHEVGAPVDVSTAAGSDAAADMLLDVHRAAVAGGLPAVPGCLLDWFDEFLPPDHAAHQALARLRAAEPRLTRGIVYGDPAPEVLIDAGDPRPALIDWGTPSHGPLLHDVAAWANWVQRGNGDAERFVARYRDAGLLADPEWDHLAAARELAATLITVTTR